MLPWKYLRWTIWAWLASVWLLPGLHGAALAAPVAHAVLDANALPPVPLAQDAVTTLDGACILPGSDMPPGPQAAWQHVALPHVWQDTHAAYEGAMWYRFRVTMPRIPGGLWAVYVPRAVMNAQVWVNGVPMAYTGSMSKPVTRNWYTPLLVQVPTGLWREGDNVIHIKVVSGYKSRDGLSLVSVGPLAMLEGPYKTRLFLQMDGAYFANTAVLALGAFMMIAWLRDRDQLAIGYQGASALLWGVGNAAYLAAHPFFDDVVWVTLSISCMVWSALAMALFFRRFVGRRSRMVERSVLALMLVTPVWAWLSSSVYVVALGYGLAYLIFMVCMMQAIHGVVMSRRRDGVWLLAGCALLVPSAAHDVAFQIHLLPFDAMYTLPFVGPIMMACIFYVLAGDYARSRRALNRLNGSLAETLAQREAALRESFARLAELERAQAVSAERSRILRDMHDGVGAHLTSALRQLQPPGDQGVDLGLVTQTLRDSLDQLKLSIDALSLQEGDVVGLLASLRFRITPRLKAAGLALLWDVADLPPWPAGHAPALRQLQYILFEGLSNVLQHSGATRLTLSARAEPDWLQVSLIDNGRGWSGEGEGQGLQTMRARANVIGARIAFLTRPEGGAELRVSLPLAADEQPRSKPDDGIDLSSAA